MADRRRPDWLCPNCNFNIYGSKDSCFKCHFNRSDLGRRSEPKGRSGDWTCPTCQFLIYGTKDSCFKCNYKRSDLASSVSRSAIPSVSASVIPSVSTSAFLPQTVNKSRTKRPDWMCPNCNFLIFGSKDRCSKCNHERGSFPNTPRPDVPIETELVPESVPVSESVSVPVLPASIAESNLCVICYAASPTHAIKVCGHFCYCETCGFATNKCPLCRAPYDPDTDLMRIFS